MIKFIIKRILSLIPVIIGVTFVVFCINEFTPGDPVAALLGSEYTQEAYDAMYLKLGLDKPFIIRYLSYLWGIITEFDLGTCYQTKLPVKDLILDCFPITFQIVLYGVIIAMIVGIIIGIISAVKQYSIIDYITTVIATFLTAIPTFWLAMMAVIIFSLRLGWFPPSGIDTLACWILPVVCVSCLPLSNIVRQTRSSMLECIRQDYVRTARAKGVEEKDVVLKHAFRNSLIPIITIIGMQVGVLMGGASMVMETIFTIPGLGQLTLTAIQQNNYPVIQGCTLFLSIVCSVCNLIVDVAYGYVDPRIKAQYVRANAKKKKAAKTEAKGVTA